MIHFPAKYPLKVFKYRSKSSPELEYEVSLWENGEIYCDCPASTFRKRLCWHKEDLTDNLMAKFGGIQEAINYYKNEKGKNREKRQNRSR